MKAVNKWASVVKLFCGAVFIISAVSKLVTIDSFEMYVYSFGLFPLVLCFYLSRLLIAAELLLGVALISHRNHRFSTISSLLFLLFFVVFLVYAQLIGRTDSCHCFGDLLPFNPVQSIMKNAVMILMMLFVYKYAAHDWYPRWWLVSIIYICVAALFVLFSIKMLHALDLYSLVLLAVSLGMGVLASFPFFSRWWMTVPLILAPFVTTFILSPPDSWFYHEGDVRCDKELFTHEIQRNVAVEDDSEPMLDTALQDTSAIRNSDTTLVAENVIYDTVAALSKAGLDKGRHLVAFFSPSCGYCRLAAEKISTMATRGGIDKNKVVYVFPGALEQERYDSFYQRANSCKYSEVRIDRELFVRITRAAFPLIFLVEDGEVVATYAYRAIDEQKISEFLSK